MRADLTVHRRALGLAVVALVAFAPLSALAALPAQAETTSSAKTVTAKEYDPEAADSPFPDLSVSVSQTEDLIQQGIKVSWTGGALSQVPQAQHLGGNFFQVAQCWGDEAGTNGARPDRTTCQYGGFNLNGAQRDKTRRADTAIPDEDAPYTAQGTWPSATYTAIPFRSATGTVLAPVVDGERVENPPSLYNNEFFTKFTTNEVSWAGSGADGSGSVSFELQTAQQAPGLGCGAATETAAGVTGAPCWLVIIPRGNNDVDGGVEARSSGLFWENWKHHIAIRLKFKPIGLRCAIGAAERQLSGSELLSGAVGQWQPTLCNKAGGAVYSLLTGPESDAALAANGTTTAPLALTSRALSVDGVIDNLTYAPIALTGVSVAFAIDRYHGANDAPDDVVGRDRQPFESLKLNPRLLAKLLTASYKGALPNGADKTHLGKNPGNLSKDPDFLAINSSDWAYMSLNGVGISDVLMPLGRSDAARVVWEYIMADAEARDFLAGRADPWGMTVNPYFSTNAALNPTGVGLTLPRDDFPKADPATYEGSEEFNHLDEVNLVSWRPFTSSLDNGGYLVLRGDAQKIGDFEPTSTPPKYGKAPRDVVGLRQVVGLTSTSSAARYQVVEASLLNAAGKYVAPTSAALSAAAAAMTKDAHQGQVAGFDSTSSKARRAVAAYPLSMPVYAAASASMDDQAARSDYASFITLAVTTGQAPGTDDGQLPGGYAPLPVAWRKQALASAAVIKAGGSALPASTPPDSTGTGTRTGTSTQGGGVDTSSAGGTASNPVANGDPAGSLAGSNTPADPAIGLLAAVVPTGAAVGLAAVLGVPLMSRFRRRQT